MYVRSSSFRPIYQGPIYLENYLSLSLVPS
ncbi:cytochrome b [Bienertia sinuspersici]